MVLGQEILLSLAVLYWQEGDAEEEKDFLLN